MNSQGKCVDILANGSFLLFLSIDLSLLGRGEAPREETIYLL